MRTDQRFKHSVVSRAVIAALWGTGAMLVSQDTLAQQSTSSLQRVEVTGSNIRRTDTETASPVQVISKEEIDQSGKSTLGEYLQTLTADGQGSVPVSYGRGFAAGSGAGISLRGLGANATLVLVNGRRVAPAVLADDAQRSFVDLNAIPMEAVERVEVLKDGASSIYGSDAVAGVVNIILKKSFVGTVAKATYGVTQKGDGGTPRLAITHGSGDLQKDGYNYLLNLEAGSQEPIFYRNRGGLIGTSAIASLGWDPSFNGSNNVRRAAGHGFIPVNPDGTHQTNVTTGSIVGNVRNPATTVYYARSDLTAQTGFARTFPGAAAYCAGASNIPQTAPGNSCSTDLWKAIGMVQPKTHHVNLYGRFTKALSGDNELYAEVGYYKSYTRVEGGGLDVGLLPSGGNFTNLGVPISNTATTLLGAGHPDNPYNAAARFSYNTGLELGGRSVHADADSVRAVAGMKGTIASWDYDTAITFSEGHETDTAEKTIITPVARALLNPTAANIAAAVAVSPRYAALPPGTVWRIGENAGLNSPALYSALTEDLQRKGVSRNAAVDLKLSREVGTLPGGPIGVALGAELRKESIFLPLYPGVDNHTGPSFTTYKGDRRITATYAEGLFPVTKMIEASAAVRYDNYSDAGTSVTPKVGLKIRALSNLALRGTYAEGFRAPTATENSADSLAAFGGATVNDRVRTAAGVPNQDSVAPTFVQRGNPNLSPEKSRSTTIGLVWDALSTTSVALDLWQIRRSGLPVIEDPQLAVDAGRVIRDPATSQNAADPGAILAGYVQFVNSAESLTRGVDLDLKHRMTLANGMGRLTMGASWTHLIKQRVIDADGTVHDYAGTHGNCDITNCMGTPRDRISFNAAWDVGAWNLGAIINYRGTMNMKSEEADTTCFNGLGAPNPAVSCPKLGSFATLDLAWKYKFSPATEVFGTIQNALNRKPPFDPITYGAIGYNPLDAAGALGRSFTVGLRHQFR